MVSKLHRYIEREGTGERADGKAHAKGAKDAKHGKKTGDGLRHLIYYARRVGQRSVVFRGRQEKGEGRQVATKGDRQSGRQRWGHRVLRCCGRTEIIRLVGNSYFLPPGGREKSVKVLLSSYLPRILHFQGVTEM